MQEAWKPAEDFFVEYDNGDRLCYHRKTIYGEFIFQNNRIYTATIILDAASYTFGNNSKFRIRCDASGNNDHIFIDDVNISGVVSNDECSNAITLTPNELCIPTRGSTRFCFTIAIWMCRIC